MNDTIAQAIEAKLDRAATEARTADIATLIFTIESTTAAITRISEAGHTNDPLVAAELDMHFQIRLFARNAIIEKTK